MSVIAGEEIDAMDFVYIGADGKAYKSNGDRYMGLEPFDLQQLQQAEVEPAIVVEVPK
jgi:hypothetical protein